MKRTDKRHLLALLLLIATAGSVYSQSLTLVPNDTVYMCSVGSYSQTLAHNSTSNTGLDAWVIINTSDTTSYLYLSFLCTDRTSPLPLPGYISLWEGDSATGATILNQFSGSSLDTILTIHSNSATLHVHYDAYSITLMRNLELNAYNNYTPNNCNLAWLSSLSAKRITTTSADLKWTNYDTSNSVTVKVDGRWYTVTGDSLHLSGLTPNTPYYVSLYPSNNTNDPCCALHTLFYTNPRPLVGIPRPTDFDSTYVRAYYGSVSNPFMYVGYVDHGPFVGSSRHCLNTDTTRRDFNTDNLLPTVCPGKGSSIRLGNWITGAQAEALTYYLHVDTNLYSLIMLHYAAILQNPGHVRIAQPRFRMEVVDENDSVIDAQCGAANFYADESLGWNTSSTALWKDWTTVGINLSPYHGQDVCLRFITYDCAEGGHFGYAYFTFDCQIPTASSELCGDIDTNTLTAPDGFNYLWYHDSPSNPVSTSQSVTYATSDGNIHCRLSFIENPSCYITMDTYVSNFWPLAEFDTFYTVNRGCDGFEVQFINRSTIVDDNRNPFPNRPPCESAVWNFGDGSTSTDYNPKHTYHINGPQTVTLIAGLAGGMCLDTFQLTIDVPDAYIPVDQHLTTCDSLRWIDGVWYSTDTVGPTKRIRILNKCDTLYTLHLSLLPIAHHYLPADTFCYNSPYVWRGHSAPINRTSTDTLFPVLTDTLVGTNGCDSIDYLPLIQLPPDPLSIHCDADCGLGFYLLTAVTDNPVWQWSSSPPDPAIEGHENDQQLGLTPDTVIAYSLTSYYDSSFFCPTTTTIRIAPSSFPKAILEVNPQVLSYDKSTLYAHDLSDKHYNRHWAIVNHGPGHDTLALPDTLRHLVYPVQLNYDSITVILTVSNAFCLDTASQTLPIVRHVVFAPNVFTPDADINNRFTIVCNGVLEAELTIYNRQGLLVYTTSDLINGWDGTHNGTPCPQGAYVWHLHYRRADWLSEWTSMTGTVTLLR